MCAEVSHAWLAGTVEDRSGKVSKGPPVCSAALSCLCACMSLISLRPNAGEKKQENKGCWVRGGDAGRRGEVGEVQGERR